VFKKENVSNMSLKDSYY